MAYFSCCYAFDSHNTTTANIMDGVLNNAISLEEQSERALTEASSALSEATETAV